MKKYICDKCGVYMKEFVGLNEVCLKRIGFTCSCVEELEWRIVKKNYCLRCANEMGIDKSGLLLVSNTLYSGRIRDENDWREDAYDIVMLNN